MKRLQILGTGCPKCDLLTANTQAAAEQLGIEFEIEKVTQVKKIMEFGVMMTPALVVDGTVAVSGSVPDVEAIMTMLGR